MKLNKLKINCSRLLCAELLFFIHDKTAKDIIKPRKNFISVRIESVVVCSEQNRII